MNVKAPLKHVVFLDRDGVINRDSADFIKSWDEFEWIPGSRKALRLLHETGHSVILVTNQSGVGRGLISPDALETMHRNLKLAAAEAGGAIRDIFFCPHHPESGCRCRKPSVGLVEQACRRYRIDLAASVLVGDSLRDIECGLRAGCGRTVLVRTGKGAAALTALDESGLRVDYCAADLLEAAEWIIRQRRHDQAPPDPDSSPAKARRK
jgi:D-glycero-D-manno-heptose 1,7-bisphosphate phosphatase